MTWVFLGSSDPWANATTVGALAKNPALQCLRASRGTTYSGSG
jgi:hypothetical protein